MGSQPNQPQARRDWLRIFLIVLALSYALLAGLRTVSDLDLGWQLATGRYLVQHHQIPRQDVFSYTARGKEWLYPPFSGALFYVLFLAGGYAALSWLGAVACAGTAGCVVASGDTLNCLLAIVAVPAIAFRTNPRAELFTTVFFAAVLCLVWRNHLGRPTPLWVTPPIFFLWTNLHLGYFSGLTLLGAGVFFELCDMLFADRRAAAWNRMRRLLPWAGASFAATLLNPWGWRIYEAIARQNNIMKAASVFIGEWSAVHFNSLALRQALDPRDPASADWWLLAIAALAVVAALWKKRLGPAAVLAAGIYASVEHIRLQAVFAILVAVIGGSLLSELGSDLAARINSKATGSRESPGAISPNRISPGYALAIASVFTVLVGLRIADLVTQRYYIESEQITLFGTGPSWWYPERAAAFLKREHLPGNVFHAYNFGGFLTWRIAPEYSVFADGRYIPFAGALFEEQGLLTSLGPDSPEWKRAEDRWQFNTAIFSVARFAGLGTFPLQEFCSSDSWKPVYLDDVSVVFVRNRPENGDWIRRLGIRCENAPLPAPQSTPEESFRARAERFQYLMNSGSLFYALARDSEAASTLAEAEQIFPEDPGLHLVKAQMLAATNRPVDAEREYLGVVNGHPSDAAWFALAHLYSSEHRYAEALRCVNEAASLSLVPYERLRSAALLYLYMNQSQDALVSLARSERESPYQDESSDLAKEFNARIAETRARAYRQLNQLDRAVTEQKVAASLTPQNAMRWNALAELYDAQGRADDSSQARRQAQAIQKASSNLVSEANRNP